MANNTRFGPSGNDVMFYEQGNKSSTQAPAWLKELGLDAFEINFGRGIKMGGAMAQKLGDEARKNDIELSVHAPYYINLASPDSEMLQKSYGYIEKCVSILKTLGFSRLIVHIGSQGTLERDVAIENCKANLKWVIDELRRHGHDDFLLCIETMGRYKAIGNYTEICDICSVDECVIPTLDFGHINCLEQGELVRNSARFGEILDYCIAKLGYQKMKKVHVHISAIRFGLKGELAHTVLADKKWAFPFEPLAKAIKDRALEPVIICESSEIMAQDAKRLQDIWLSI